LPLVADNKVVATSLTQEAMAKKDNRFHNRRSNLELETCHLGLKSRLGTGSMNVVQMPRQKEPKRG
jgi:hypothetical protein